MSQYWFEEKKQQTKYLFSNKCKISAPDVIPFEFLSDTDPLIIPYTAHIFQISITTSSLAVASYYLLSPILKCPNSAKQYSSLPSIFAMVLKSLITSSLTLQKPPLISLLRIFRPNPRLSNFKTHHLFLGLSYIHIISG